MLYQLSYASPKRPLRSILNLKTAPCKPSRETRNSARAECAAESNLAYVTLSEQRD
jgi:hypothetical protein